MHIRLIPHYFVWHYTLGLRDFFRVMHGLLVAIVKIFSLPVMCATFFQPFERLGERYHGGVSTFLETFIVNTLMRMVGMIVRACVIVLGSTAYIAGVAFAMISSVIWLCMPCIVVIILFISLTNIIALV